MRLLHQCCIHDQPGVQERWALLHTIVVGRGLPKVEITAELLGPVCNDLVKVYLGVAPKITIAIHDVAAQIYLSLTQDWSSTPRPAFALTRST